MAEVETATTRRRAREKAGRGREGAFRGVWGCGGRGADRTGVTRARAVSGGGGGDVCGARAQSVWNLSWRVMLSVIYHGGGRAPWRARGVVVVCSASASASQGAS